MSVKLGWETLGGAVSLTRDLASLPDAVRLALRGPIRTAGQKVLERAQARAGVWSSRIPGAMSLRVRLAGDLPGAIITISAAKAPHARPYEGILDDPFRHPVFGTGIGAWTWVSQAARPSLWPAAQESAGEVESDIRAAIDAAMKQHNL